MVTGPALQNFHIFAVTLACICILSFYDSLITVQLDGRDINIYTELYPRAIKRLTTKEENKTQLYEIAACCIVPLELQHLAALSPHNSLVLFFML